MVLMRRPPTVMMLYPDVLGVPSSLRPERRSIVHEVSVSEERTPTALAETLEEGITAARLPL